MNPSEMPAPTPESRIAPVDSVHALRETRMQAAEQKALNCLIGGYESFDPDHSLGTRIADTKDTNLSYDIGRLGYGDLLGFDAFGVRPEDLLASHGQAKENGVVATCTEGAEVLTAHRYFDGVTMNFAVAGHKSDFDNPREPELIREKIRARLHASPIHAAIAMLKNKEPVNFAVMTDPVDPEEDRLGALAFIQDAGFMGESTRANEHDLREKTPIVEILNNSAVRAVNKEEDESGVTYTRQENGLTKKLHFDAVTGKCSVEFSTNPDAFYQERSNQSVAESIPFVDTDCAKELLGKLDDAGLMLHPTVQAEMTRIGEAARFGSVYTQLSRELAKWVDRPSRLRASNLFVRFDPDTFARPRDYTGYSSGETIHRERQEQKTDEARAADEQFAQERLMSIDASQLGEPAKILIQIAQDAIDRKDADNLGLKSLPVTKSDVQIDGGACFDVATYYVGAAAGRNSLREIEDNGVGLLEKTHGAHTFMLQEPAVLNGVRLPHGTLMQRGEDGGWAMLRLTPFCFDNPNDQLATGSELAKTYRNEVETVRSIGGATLRNLIEGARQSNSNAPTKFGSAILRRFR